MAETNWCDVLGWGPMHLQELRFSGFTYFKEGKYEIAKIFFDALTVLDPENAYDRRVLGATYMLLGDHNKAIKVLEEAIQLDSTHLGAQINRTKALFFLGNIQEGLESAQKLIHCSDKDIANDAQALILAYKS
ncbi:MAG: tetratricopeptide repeat protein [Chlamydiales bacterium]|nr:tetratricopeptide repeat protein [Chlamydiales bacterium]